VARALFPDLPFSFVLGTHVQNLDGNEVLSELRAIRRALHAIILIGSAALGYVVVKYGLWLPPWLGG
jgi:hypothetical protein